jgi:hypothetical protein
MNWINKGDGETCTSDEIKLWLTPNQHSWKWWNKHHGGGWEDCKLKISWMWNQSLEKE